jgi:ketosteroid isomerase-like protein
MEGTTHGAAIVQLPARGGFPAAPPISRARPARMRLEVVERRLEAYNRRDIAALRALTDPRVEIDWSTSRGPHAGIYRGIDAAIRFYEDWFSMFEELDIEAECMVVEGLSVVVPNVARMRGRDGIAVTARSILVYTFSARAVIGLGLRQADASGRRVAA